MDLLDSLILDGQCGDVFLSGGGGNRNGKYLASGFVCGRSRAASSIAASLYPIQKASDFHIVQPIMNILGRTQIPHRRFQAFMPHPVLNRPHVEAGPEHARGVSRTELPQVKAPRIELCAPSNFLTSIEHVQLAVATG